MRGMVRRALVLTPPSLVTQWKGELSEKFGLLAASPDSAEFRREPARFWKEQPLVVASIAMARLEPHAAAIAGAPWDMVIVDEAHCLKSRTSANWGLVDSLQKKFILMLTATPVENNLLELYNLITLLKPGLLATEAEFRKRYVTAGQAQSAQEPRTTAGHARRGDDPQYPGRGGRATAAPHRGQRDRAPPRRRRRGYTRMVSHFVAGRYRLAGRRPLAAQALDLMQRQAGSSPQALGRSVARALSRGRRWVQSGRELEPILDLASGIDASGKANAARADARCPPGQGGGLHRVHPDAGGIWRRICEALGHLLRGLQRRPLARGKGRRHRAVPRPGARAALHRRRRGRAATSSSPTRSSTSTCRGTPCGSSSAWAAFTASARPARSSFSISARRGTVEEQLLRVLHDKINMFELVVGEMDAILGTLDESRDFAEIVMDLWLSGRESGEVEQAFEELAARLLDAKKQQKKAQELDDSLFARDFEV